MRSRRLFWILLGVLLLAGAWLFWPHGGWRAAEQNSAALQKIAAQKKSALQPSFTTKKSSLTAPQFLTGKNSTNAVQSAAKTNQFPWRLTNTKKSIGELAGDRHAILLENALIDTGAKLDLAIPKNLQAQGDPGAYIVQARGPIDAAFRAQLAAAGAQIVSYIPNNAYLVRVPAGGANELASLPLAQSVIPYEPYYKISSTLIGQAVEYPDALPSAPLTLGLFANDADTTIAAIQNLGGQIIATGNSPFGPTVRVLPPKNWTALATLPGVQIVEPFHQRMHANDLSRATTGVAADPVTTTNYLNLGGLNVMVAVDDSGIDQLHPDFTAGGTGPVRIFADDPANLMDTDGHGTFVAGQIAGDGTESITVTNVQGSIITNLPGPTASPFQFRGKAPLAHLFSMNFEDSDQALQAAAALTNALISNNSWNYDDTTYDLAAASYDAATRDALPLVTGSQPVLFVFSAGNIGHGDDTADPGGGNADTILSPATAKNVITVGAIQQLRNITNEVTEPDGTTNAIWAAETSTPDRVAGFSSRGNVGIGIEGPTGRDKPDVVAPGTFVVSTRSEQWDINSYFFQSPTNHDVQEFDNVIAQPDSIFASSFPFVPNNAVQAIIQVVQGPASPVPFPFLPIYVGLESSPGFTFFTTNNAVSIPSDGGLTIADILNSENFVGFNFGVSNTTTEPISFDLITDLVTTNNIGNEFLVLSNLDQFIGTINNNSTGPGPYYRYESGTSMAAADVSGVLALMQDFFTNTMHATPSPALMKAMLINGARATRFYNFGSQNPINFEGWGEVQLPNSLPLSITNLVTEPAGGTNTSIFFLDQSRTNALATGDSQTFMVTVDTNSLSATLPLRVTLAWTDPPGNPAAAIKLVNNLDLVVTNLVTGDVFFGNDIPADSVFNSPWNTNGPQNLDTINNIENVFLSQPLSGSYSITVIGRDVNVNAVTAQTNNAAGNFAPNTVQDYALVVSCGDSASGGAITVANNGIVSPTSDQQVTFVNVNANGMATNNTSTGGVFLNQLAGANTPLLGTNKVQLGGTNELVTLGMTNQWHFYVVQNTTGFTNAAFVTFLPDTLATPRMGVFAGSDANSTQPEADIDLYVSTDPSLTNLNPLVISNCVNGTQVGASIPGLPPFFNGASLGRGGTEFVVDTNSTPGTEVYYVGVKSETAEAAEYGFLPVISQQPFSQMVNGNEVVNGLLLPVNIPDGTPAHPGTAYIFALAVQPIEVQDIIVSDQIVHQNFGDLIGTLSHGSSPVVLNNHDSLGSPPGPYNFIYDDSPSPVAGSQPPDGPGSLQNFQGQQGIGPWILAEADDSLTQTGAVTGFSLLITPHQDLGIGISGTLPPGGVTNFFIDVPVGTTNLSISATNTTISTLDTNHPIQLFEKFEALPTPQQPPPPTNFDQMVLLTNFPPALSVDPGNTISVGQTNAPPIQPGRYFVTLWNPSILPQTFFIISKFEVEQVAPVNFGSGGPVPLLDDAVTYAFITNNFTAGSTNETIAAINVGIRVDHPRISDLVFHLISPDGTRFLLMENRGGTSTNGAGVTIFTTNAVQSVASGNNASNTNIINVGETSGTLPISYSFFTVPDQMTVYYGTNLVPANLIYNSGSVSGSNNITVSFPPPSPTDISSNLTIVMNQFGNTNISGDLWNYTAGGVTTNYFYLVFTEDTNLTTIPIKFAPTPFVPGGNVVSGNLVANGNFETPVVPTSGPNPGLIPNIATGFTGWTVDFGNVDLVGLKSPGNPYWQAAVGNQSIDLNGQLRGAIYQDIPTIAGQVYNLRFAHACNPDGKTNHTVSVFWAGVNVTNALFTNVNTTVTSMGWQYVTLPVIGSGGLNRLEFEDLNIGENGAGPTLDDVSLSPVIVPNNLYYLPEESLDSLVGTSAYGLWQLEIQDDRVGATNNAVLDSWQLQFVFANTNPIPSTSIPTVTLTNGVPLTNVVPANSTSWFLITVPPNADIATNDLIFATAPVNLLFNQTTPDTNGDFTLLTNQLNGISILTIGGTPPLIPGSPYFLGVQNINSFAVTNAIEVTFHLFPAASPFAFTQPAQAVTGTNAQLNGMATPNGLPATAWFEWGTNTAYGNQTPPVSVGNSANVVYVTNSISLMPNVPYHFRLVVSNALAVVTGFDQILDEANVVVWGANFEGQLAVPAGLSNVVAIAGAYDHSLALKNDETAAVWGDDTFGQTNVPAGLNNNLVAVAGGESYSLALKNNGTVIAWGANIFPGETNVPAGLNNVVTIASGQYSSLALQNNGTVVAWGANISGLTNVPVSLNNNVVAIAGGSFHNLAIKNDGTVVAWGDDSAGQTNVPIGLTNVVAISGGSFHSLALKNDGTVVAWGDDSAGQTNVPAGLSNVVAVAAGGFHSLALKNDGSIVGWGDNSASQLTAPSGLTNFVAIAAGNLHSLALTPQSILNLTNIVLNFTNGVPQTNSIVSGGVTFYQINVPANADFATNLLLFASAPLNILFTTNAPPTTNGAAILLANSTNGVSVLSTTSFPTNITPGAVYYLGVQNTNSFTVNYAVEVNFHLLIAPPVFISSITATNMNGTNGFLLTWFAPSNDLFQVQWNDNLGSTNWTTFTNPPAISYNPNFPASATNAQFNFFDDGSQTPPGLPPIRFYRLILLQSTNPPPPANAVSIGGITAANNGVTNGFLLKWSAPSNDLFQVQWNNNLGSTNWTTFTNPPAISYNTNFAASLASAQFTFFDDGSQTPPGLPPIRFYRLILLQSTNPPQASPILISNVLITTNGLNLVWSAPTNDQFQVQWTTNLAPPVVWMLFPGTNTSTTGTFTFLDTNAPMMMKFYELILLP